jgi:hypothetical protein
VSSLLVATFQPYFNIDTPEVVRRLVAAVHPLRTKFLSDAAQPDLYGALWLPLTGAFAMLAFGSLSTRFESGDGWQFDLFAFLNAVFLLYAHIAISPIVYHFFTRAPAPAVACLVGYSLAAMVVVALFCLIVGSRADFVIAAIGSSGCGIALFAKLGGGARATIPNAALAAVHGLAIFAAERLTFRYAGDAKTV